MNTIVTSIFVSGLGLVAFVATASEPQTAATTASASRAWQRIDVPTGENCFVLTFDPKNSKRALLGTRPGGLWETVDDGATFVRRETGMPSARATGFNAGGIVAHPRVAGLWYAGTEGNGPYRSRDNGVTWESCRKGIGSNNERHGVCLAFDAKDDATLYYGSDMGIFKSTAGGDQWTKCTKGLPTGISGDKKGNTTVCRLVVHPKTGAIYAAFYAVGYGETPGIYRSTNHGESWTAINQGWDAGVDQEATAELLKRLIKVSGDKANPQLKENYEKVLRGEPVPGGWMKGWTFDLRMAVTDPQILFGAAQCRLIRTRDGGENWTECPTVAHPRSVAIHPQDPRIVVASGTWQIWLSRNGGDSWTDVTRDLGKPPASDAKVAPHTQCLEFDPAGQRIFACTDAGVWVAAVESLR